MRCDREQVISSLNPFRLVIYRRQRARLRSYFSRTRRVSLSYFGVHTSPYLLPLLVRTVTHDSSCVTPTALLPLRLVSSPLLSLHFDVFCFLPPSFPILHVSSSPVGEWAASAVCML